MSCDSLDQGLAIYVATVAQNQSFTVGVSGTGATKTISIDANATGRWLFRIQLVDDNTDPNSPTLTVPSGNQESVFMRYTDADGTLSLAVTHAGSTHTWYPIVTCLGIANNDSGNALIYS